MPPEKTLDPSYDRVISEISYRTTICDLERNTKKKVMSSFKGRIVVLGLLAFPVL